jgi:uncharacterized protein YcnI
MAALGLTLGAGIASAHVSVNPSTAVAGSYTKITFRVPNESAKADTVKVTVQFPMDHPFASVSVKKESGWTAAVTSSKLATPISDDDNASITEAVSSITWTADASGRIALGQFAEFDLSVGPVPKVASLAFTAIQTYSDGSVVKWDEPTPASGEEPEHPAPVLTITPADGGAAVTPASGAASTAAGDAAQSAPTVTVTAAPSAAAAVNDSDGTARTLGVVGIIIGALGLLGAAVAIRGRRASSS